MRISEQFTGSLKSFAGGGKPLDPLIERLESDMTVTYFMLPFLAAAQTRKTMPLAWLQLGILQAGKLLPSKACLRSSWMLQGSPINRASVTS